MNCDQAEELLGAYALDALPADEAAGVRAHLVTCETHAAKARELRAVALSLGTSVEPLAPPPALRDRIAGAIAADAAPRTATRTTSSTSPVSLDERRERRRWFGAPSPAWGAIAAVLVLAVAGLIGWNVTLRSDGSSPAVLAVRPLLQDTGATAGYAVMFDDGTMAVQGDALPRLDASQVYQLWALTDEGEARSLGLMEYNDAGAPVAQNITFDPEDATAVAITIEPAGGSDQPTSDPLYTAET